MNALFSRYSLALATLLLLSATSAVGQIWIDGKMQAPYYEDDEEYLVYFFYTNFADVGTATVGGDYGASCSLSNYGKIAVANVYQDGQVFNGIDGDIGYSTTGYITTANVGDLGTVFNGNFGGTGYITTANVGDLNSGNFGFVYNGCGGTGYITTVNVGELNDLYNVNVGFVYNGSGGTGYIETVNVNVGFVYNGCDGTTGYITTANVNAGGNVSNGSMGTIETANVYVWSIDGFDFGGSIDNAGRIDNMNYTAGTYEWQTGGTIGTLTLAGNSADNAGDWGIVENLQFADDGSGFMSITGFADGSFSGINVTESVNLANGNLQLSLTGSVDDWLGWTSWDALFGGAMVDGWESALFNVSWTESDFYTDWFGFEQQWNLGNGYFVTFGANGLNIASVPEPATLAIIGLGLAGLGLARRRK